MTNVTGTAGSDTITPIFTSIGVIGLPGSGADVINAGAGNDLIAGGGGNDTINGGSGIDTATYADAVSAVTVSLAAGTATGGAGFDVLIDIENVIGSNFADTLIGNLFANILRGGDGNDTLDGGAGSDTINGGAGIDTASYATATSSVAVSLASGTATGGAGFDVLSEIENVVGSNFADTLTGNGLANQLSGGLGNDTFIGTFGDDTLKGGDDNDTANYSSLGALVTLGALGVVNKGGLGMDNLDGIETIIGSSSLGDTIDLSGASAAPASGTVTNLTAGSVTVNGDSPLPLSFTVSQFENVIGSGFADSITGNNLANTLVAAAGTTPSLAPPAMTRSMVKLEAIPPTTAPLVAWSPSEPSATSTKAGLGSTPLLASKPSSAAAFLATRSISPAPAALQPQAPSPTSPRVLSR
jgi:Ca2+-binding RTX toxin-like protein